MTFFQWSMIKVICQLTFLGNSWTKTIEIVATPRSGTTKENNSILLWNNWVANQLTFSQFLMNVCYCYIAIATVYLSADFQPNYVNKTVCFSFVSMCMISMTKTPLKITFIPS